MANGYLLKADSPIRKTPVKKKWGTSDGDLAHAEAALLVPETQKLSGPTFTARGESDNAPAVPQAKRVEIRDWRECHVFEFDPETAVD